MKIEKLKVRPKRVENLGACIPETAAVLTCWSNNSSDSPSCQQTVQALTDCMRNAKSQKNRSNTVNYHLARLSKYL
ncbi:hypothetical protein Glove_197g84 [Diversispora epigaea]|uniref:CHCH domain-containing protein n=1 Tax=Diversispora epigaea TaxID=1348612 RepID=A0A397IRS3_9GLOM|nr:hypothetical protein Glove_197g84 [Diversispora epigaea]